MLTYPTTSERTFDCFYCVFLVLKTCRIQKKLAEVRGFLALLTVSLTGSGAVAQRGCAVAVLLCGSTGEHRRSEEAQ